MSSPTQTLTETLSPSPPPLTLDTRMHPPSPILLSLDQQPPAPQDPSIITCHDIVHSLLLPSHHKPLLLTHLSHIHTTLSSPPRSGTGFHATGATTFDRLIAAEQLARLSLTYGYYVDQWRSGRLDVEGGSGSESMASAMVDAALAVSGWRGGWDQGMFWEPLCLGDREREVAELTSWCLRRYGERPTQRGKQSVDVGAPRRTPKLSAEQILTWWNRSVSYDATVLRVPTENFSRDLLGQVDWSRLHNRRRGRSKVEKTRIRIKELTAEGREDLDHEVWLKWAENASSKQAALEVVWPPECSLEGHCLMEKHAAKRNACEAVTWLRCVYLFVSYYFRKYTHLWCLRCFRQRRRGREASCPTAWACAVMDAAFMILGIFIVLEVEAFIAWTDDRVPKEGPWKEKIRKAWPLFLESEVEDARICGQRPDSSAGRMRHRSCSCP